MLARLKTARPDQWKRSKLLRTMPVASMFDQFCQKWRCQIMCSSRAPLSQTSCWGSPVSGCGHRGGTNLWHRDGREERTTSSRAPPLVCLSGHNRIDDEGWATAVLEEAWLHKSCGLVAFDFFWAQRVFQTRCMTTHIVTTSHCA